jgi:hypothetical protein
MRVLDVVAIAFTLGAAAAFVVAAAFLTDARDVEAAYCLVLGFVAVRAGVRLGGEEVRAS